MLVDLPLACCLRTQVNSMAKKLRHNFYQTKIADLDDGGSRGWWKQIPETNEAADGFFASR